MVETRMVEELPEAMIPMGCEISAGLTSGREALIYRQIESVRMYGSGGARFIVVIRLNQTPMDHQKSPFTDRFEIGKLIRDSSLAGSLRDTSDIPSDVLGIRRDWLSTRRN